MRKNRPQAVASYTKDIVYERLAPGILKELVLFLRNKAIPEDEILRLRLDEPELILTYCRMDKQVKN